MPHQRDVAEPKQVISILEDRKPLAGHPHDGFSGEKVRRSSVRMMKKGARKKRLSPFYLLLSLMGAALGIVLYISNIIAVDQLLNEINDLEAEHHRILMQQELLRSQVNHFSSLERVQSMAETELGLENYRKPPVWIEIDPEKIQDLDQLLTEESEKER